MIKTQSVNDWLRSHILYECNMNEPISMNDIDNRLKDTEKINRLCDARLRLGFVRYESRLGIDQDPGYLSRAFTAIYIYEFHEHNKEYLIDAINYLKREFENPSFENTYFKPTDHPE